MLREVRDSEAQGERQSAALDLQAGNKRREMQRWHEHVAAGEEDRRLLFGEAHVIEQQMRMESARKRGAQRDAAAEPLLLPVIGSKIEHFANCIHRETHPRSQDEYLCGLKKCVCL